jgi:hypothetical protein
MRKEYSKNNKIAICGTQNEIAEAVAILDILDGLEGERNGCTLRNESEICITIQDAIEVCDFKAVIFFGGKMLYPFVKTLNSDALSFVV